MMMHHADECYAAWPAPAAACRRSAMFAACTCHFSPTHLPLVTALNVLFGLRVSLTLLRLIVPFLPRADFVEQLDGGPDPAGRALHTLARGTGAGAAAAVADLAACCCLARGASGELGPLELLPRLAVVASLHVEA